MPFLWQLFLETMKEVHTLLSFKVVVFSLCLVLKKKVSKEQILMIYTSIMCSLDFLDL